MKVCLLLDQESAEELLALKDEEKRSASRQAEIMLCEQLRRSRRNRERKALERSTVAA